MKLTTRSFQNDGTIPASFAFAQKDPVNHFALSENKNPHLSWTDIPEGTKSFVLVCHDPDVPSKPDDVNQEGREVPADLPRVPFYHWLLWNIPQTVSEIAEGSHSNGVVPGGKGAASPDGYQHGVNDYTAWFRGDANMEGIYHGYDGPAPPWNDSLIHHYVFTLYALNVPRLDLSAETKGADLLAAIKEHVIGEASVTGTYSLNLRLEGGSQ